MNIKRFYKNEYPEIDDIVIVKIIREDEFGYYCELLEYENIEGFLSLSELVKGRFAKKHLLKINDILPLLIIKMDQIKRIVDLSKKKLDEVGTNKVLMRYKSCLNINKLMNELYIMYLKYCDIEDSDIIYSINDIMNNTIWPLYEIYDLDNYNMIFRNILENPKLILTTEIFEEMFINKALSNMNNRTKKKNMIIELEFILMINEDNGVNKIKEVLEIQLEEKNFVLKILIMNPPLYKIKLEGTCKIKGYQLIDYIKNIITTKLQNYDNILKFQEPKLIQEMTYEIKFISDYDLEKLQLI